MSQLSERITRAYQTSGMLVSDLMQAHNDCQMGHGPEGLTMRDKTLMAYLSIQIAAAKKIMSALAEIQD
jgi:hypothetical protein